MGGQQESSCGGLHERACARQSGARDRPGLFCEAPRLQGHGRRALLHHMWGPVGSWSVLAAERVSQRTDNLSGAGPVGHTGGLRGGRYVTVFSAKLTPLQYVVIPYR